MKKYVIYSIIIFLSILGFAKINSSLDNHENDPKGIHWMTIEEAQRLNKENPKKIMIDVYTDWCGPCKKMAKKTFTNKKIVEYVNKHFYAVKFNAEGSAPVNFNGNVFINKGRTHEFAQYLGVTGYPTISFFDPDNSPIMKFTAYMNAPDMEITLEYIHKEVYRKQSFEDFEAGY